MAADQHGFDPYPGSAKHPGPSSWTGITTTYVVSDGASIHVNPYHTPDRYIYLYEEKPR